MASMRDALGPGSEFGPKHITIRQSVGLIEGECVSVDKLRGFLVELDDFLAFGTQLASAVFDLHRKGIPHGNLTPRTIFYDPAADRLIFTGSHSFPSQDERVPTKDSLKIPIADPAYMSPEQLRRIHHGVDCRTDLYSIGVILYEVLTGSLPFDAKDPLSWTHCHLARTPKSPLEVKRNIPAVVSDIIMRLLSKDIEERYQTAAGLRADLCYCFNQWHGQRHIKPIILGQSDVSDQLFISQKLYGRQQEVDTLLEGLERVLHTGRPELYLVAGYSGIGKTSLVRELYRPVIRKYGFFIWGKFDQYKRNIPYAVIIDAFRDIISQILTENEERLQLWRTRLLDALGINGQLIVELLPHLEYIIGQQQPVAELPMLEAEHRFKTVFRNFLGVFARREHPLVLFLDDLQWADAASLSLLEYLLEDSGPCYLFLLGAYRSNEVGQSHPLNLKINQLRGKNLPAWVITLQPLLVDDVKQLLADSFRCSADEVAPLAELVYNKTGGNAFFSIQFLRTLYNEGLVWIDEQALGWVWDMEKIRTKGYTDNVVDLMVANLRKLSSGAQEILKVGSCVGSTFDVRTIAAVTSYREDSILELLWEPLQVGLVLFGLTERSFSFLHDRVQQSAYSLIADERRLAMHLGIARYMTEVLPPEEQEEKIFDIVNQYNLCKEIVGDRSEKFRMAGLNLAAAGKAAASSAYSLGLTYLLTGRELVDEQGWDDNYSLMYPLYRDLAVSLYVNSDYPESRKLISELLERVGSNIEQAELYNILIIQYTLLGRYSEAIDSGKTALGLLGVELVLDDREQQLLKELADHEQLVGNRSIASLINEPEIREPSHKAALELLSNMVVPSRYTDSTLFALISIVNANLSLRYGLSEKSTVGFTSLGMFLNSELNRFEQAYAYGELALKISERFNAPAQKCQACFMLGHYLSHWVQHLRRSDMFNDLGIQAGMDSGEMQWTGYTLAYKLFQPFYRGVRLEVIAQQIPDLLSFTRKTENKWASDTLKGLQLAVGCLMGGRDCASSGCREDGTFIVEGEEEFLEFCRDNKSFGAIGRYAVMKVQLLYLFGLLDEAHSWMSRAEEMAGYYSSSISVAQLNFYSSLVTTSLHAAMGDEQQQVKLAGVLANQVQMNMWVQHCPENFAHLHLTIEAELKALEGDLLAAGRLFDQGLEAAVEQGFIQDAGVIHLAAAKWYERAGLLIARDAHLNGARKSLEKWGAAFVLARFDSEYPWVREMGAGMGEKFKNLSIGEQDAISVVKASQAISGEIVLSSLLETLMKTVLESAGAQRGTLLMQRGNRLHVEAEAHVRNQEVLVTFPETPGVVEEDMVPISVLNYVRRSLDPVILDSATDNLTYSSDLYIVRNKPVSLLCMPVMRRGRLVGILYLENNLVKGAFSVDRIAVLELLASQAAISLENASLYEEQRRAEAAIKVSEQRYRAIFDNSGTAFLFIEDDMRIGMANREFELLSGYSREEIENRKKWIEFVADPEELKQMIGYHKLRRVDPGLAPKSYEFKLVAKGGEIRDVVVTVTVFSGTRQSLAAVIDITDRKRAELEQMRLVRAMEQTSEAIFITDRHFNIIFANQAFARLNGYDQEEVVGMPARILKSDRHDADFYRNIRQTLLGGQPWSGHVRNTRKDGSLYDADAAGVPIIDSEGELVNFVVTLRDITHELQLEEELRQAQKMEAIGTLAGGIAHDFNNILTSIIGNAELVRMNMTEGDLQQKRMTQLLQSCDRAAELVTQILTFSRKTEKAKKPIHLGAVIREILSLLRSTLPTTIDIRYDEETIGDEDVVLADSTQMHQVLMNLCTNAAQAIGEEKGILEVSIKSSSHGKVVLPLGLERLQGHFLCVSVRDSGTGIAQKDLDKIFDPYFTTKSIGEGTGLGLAVVRGIVESHGGVISVESDSGQGTTFHICLPNHVGGVELPSDGVVVPPHLGRGKVLLVDDEPVLVELGSDIVKSLGYEVVGSTDSRKALALFEQSPEAYDLVLTDMTMPGLTGKDLAASIHALRPDIPVIICTGYSELMTEAGIGEMGISGYISKPYTIGSVADAISKVLRGEE